VAFQSRSMPTLNIEISKVGGRRWKGRENLTLMEVPNENN